MTEPSVTFDAIPLSADIRKAVDALGYVHPTPVQRAVFESAVRGKNLVVQARTGTGKTAAFGLPLVDQLVKKSLPKVQAIVLTPTRELALQVGRELEQLSQFRGTKIVAIYGGAPMGKQVEALEQGAQIVSGTPGRVLDHLRRGTLDASNVRIFVLDEADEMLSMGFAKELHAIAEMLPKDRQGLFFSATIPPDIERMAIAQLKDPEFITLSSDQIGALSINHFVYMLGAGDKRKELARILEVENPESAIVFCNTKDETERVAEVLRNQGYDAEWLNGDMEQKERERVMGRTREGKCRFLVATDVAARGIDISHLTHVINFDFPEAAEGYVHRTGRTGRAGKTGTAISIIGPKDIGNLYILRLTYKIRPIERQIPTAGELKTRAEHDVITMFAEAFASRAIAPDDLALARRLLTHESAEKILAGLLRDHLGARPEEAKTSAGDARRSKNPPPMKEEAPPARAQEAEALPVRPARSREPRREERPREPRREEPRRDDRPARDGRDPDVRGFTAPGFTIQDAPAATSEKPRPRSGRVPHSSFATWEPKAENDDDQPLIHRAEGVEGAAAAPVSAAPSTSNAPSGAPGENSDDEPGFAQIYVNVGKRDGVKPGDLQKMLTDGAGIERKDTGRIRIRDRNSFVSVKLESIERAVAAFQGQSIGGRTVIAEQARAKGASSSGGDASKRTETR